MDVASLIRLTIEGLLLCMYVTLPVVIVAAVVGLAVSFLQAVTSMQDQSLSHGVKLVAVVIAIIVIAPFAAQAVLHFANEAFQSAVPQ